MSYWAALAEGAGQAVDSGFNIYQGLENLKVQRNQVRNNERMNKFSRLMKLLEAGQGSQDRLSGQQRLFALRNPGA